MSDRRAMSMMADEQIIKKDEDDSNVSSNESHNVEKEKTCPEKVAIDNDSGLPLAYLDNNPQAQKTKSQEVQSRNALVSTLRSIDGDLHATCIDDAHIPKEDLSTVNSNTTTTNFPEKATVSEELVAPSLQQQDEEVKVHQRLEDIQMAEVDNSSALITTELAIEEVSQKQQDDTQVRATSDKVKVHFVAVGNAPILKKSKFKIDADLKFGNVISSLRRTLSLGAAENTSSLFLYCNAAFVPGPDERLGDIYDCFSTRGELLIHYSLKEAWG